MSTAELELQVEPLLTTEAESQFRVIWNRFRRHKLAMAGIVIIAFFIAMAILAPFVAPYDPIRYQDLTNTNAPPSAEHPLGTDKIGRDILSRLMFGARISLTVAFTVVLTVFGWMGACRLVRGQVLSLRNQDFTEAARALGVGNRRIILRHMI